MSEAEKGTTWYRTEIRLDPRPRGFHLITSEIESALPDVDDIRIGLAHIFILHTSASITLNENASSDVRHDFETHFNRMIPDGPDGYTHTIEGPDDMPAHIKASLLGSGLLIPVEDGRLRLGTWQGVYLCEHRNNGGPRKLILTVMGA